MTVPEKIKDHRKSGITVLPKQHVGIAGLYSESINRIDLKHLDAGYDSVGLEGAKRLFLEHLEEIVPLLEDMEKKMPAKV